MNFIFFTDIQYYKNLAKSYIMSDGMSSWLYNQLRVTDFIFDFAQRKGVRRIIYGGDLFEEKTRIPQDLYNIIWEYYERKADDGFELIFNTGNHDLLTFKRESSLRPFSKIVTVVTNPFNLELNDMYIRILPYGMVSNNLALPERKYQKHILITHEDISGLSYGTGDYKSATPLKPHIFSDWDLVLNGHLHKAQTLNNIINVGNPMILDWGEVDTKRFIYYHNLTAESVIIKGISFEELVGLTPRMKQVILEDNTNFFRINCSSEELNDPIFKKFNVVPNVVKTKHRELRLKDTRTIEEDMREYVNITEHNLDASVLLKIGEDLHEETKRT